MVTNSLSGITLAVAGRWPSLSFNAQVCKHRPHPYARRHPPTSQYFHFHTNIKQCSSWLSLVAFFHGGKKWQSSSSITVPAFLMFCIAQVTMQLITVRTMELITRCFSALGLRAIATLHALPVNPPMELDSVRRGHVGIFSTGITYTMYSATKIKRQATNGFIGTTAMIL